MPIFEYHCTECGNKFEEIAIGDRNKIVPCPKCGNKNTEKLLSVIGGISMGNSSSATPCGNSCPGSSTCAAGGCPHGGCQ